MGRLEDMEARITELENQLKLLLSGINVITSESNTPTVQITGVLALTGNPIVRRENILSFQHPHGGYTSGEEWTSRYYHIKVPEKRNCLQMYRYDLEGYAYGCARSLSFSWVGYLFSDGNLKQNFAHNNVIGSDISPSQYIGSDDHLYLKFGPIQQYCNSFVLHFQAGSLGESVNHDPKDYKVIITNDDIQL